MGKQSQPKETTSLIALSPTVRTYHLGVRICTERKHTSRSARSHRKGDSKSHNRASCPVTRVPTRAPVSCCVLSFSSWKERAQRGFYFMCVQVSPVFYWFLLKRARAAQTLSNFVSAFVFFVLLRRPKCPILQISFSFQRCSRLYRKFAQIQSRRWILEPTEYLRNA